MPLDSFQTELLMWALSPFRPAGVASRETKCPKKTGVMEEKSKEKTQILAFQ